MNKTTYHVSHMDCSSEEQLIRMHLEKVQDIYELRVDLTHRRLEVFHEVSILDTYLGFPMALVLSARRPR